MFTLNLKDNSFYLIFSPQENRLLTLQEKKAIITNARFLIHAV